MTRLELEFSAEVDESGLPVATSGRSSSDGEEILVFLIPGIRSDRYWASVQSFSTLSASANNLICYTVSPYGRLGLSKAILRIGLASARQSIADQVVARANEHPGAQVTFIAHSMGSALLADVIEEISSRLNPDSVPENRIKKIVFLGSVCKDHKAQMLHQTCHRPLERKSNDIADRYSVVNDVGIDDSVPFWACTLNPFHYGGVGSWGFGKAFAFDRFYKLDHSSCTKAEHIESNILPFLMDGILTAPPVAKARYSPNKSSSFRVALALFAASTISCLLFLW